MSVSCPANLRFLHFNIINFTEHITLIQIRKQLSYLNFNVKRPRLMRLTCIWEMSASNIVRDVDWFNILHCVPSVFFLWRCGPTCAMGSSSLRFLDHTQWRNTVGKTPPDEWPACRRNLYLTTQHSQETNIKAHGGIRTHSLSRQAAVELRLRPRGHWDCCFPQLLH
jgi:hypothetical protein